MAGSWVAPTRIIPPPWDQSLNVQALRAQLGPASHPTDSWLGNLCSDPATLGERRGASQSAVLPPRGNRGPSSVLTDSCRFQTVEWQRNRNVDGRHGKGWFVSLGHQLIAILDGQGGAIDGLVDLN